MVKGGRKAMRKRIIRQGVPRNIITGVTRLYTADIAKVAADSGAYATFQPLLFPITDMFGAFQLYRIKRITVEFQLYNQLNNNSAFPTLYIAPQNWTESATPSALSEVIQLKGVKTYQFGPSRPTYKQSFVPFVNTTTSGPGRMPVSSPWLSTTSDLPQHMVYASWLQNYNSTSAATHTVRIVVTADFEFKGTR